MRSALTLVVAIAAISIAATPAPGVATRPPVALIAGFPADARRGAETPVRLRLAVDARQLRSAIREVRLSFPASLGLATSGLGAATCRRTRAELEAVLIDGVGLAGCSPNAVMGRGTARAEVRLTAPGAGPMVIPELARVSMLAAPFVKGQFGLLFVANGVRPFGATLVFAGMIEPAAGPFGGTLLMRVPPVPTNFDAEIALTEIAFEIGAPTIHYRHPGARARWYRPDGIVLPRRCPTAGLPFHARLTFEDGTHAETRTSARCPRGARQG